MSKNQKYPWVSVDNSQAEGMYEISIQITENIQISYFIDSCNLEWLEKDIKLIRRMEDLKLSNNQKETVENDKK